MNAEGWVMWLTGLPGAGKSLLARTIRHKLRDDGVSTIVLDSDELRHILIPSATYTQAENDRFYQRLVDLAVWLAQEGEHIIIAATGSQRSYRAAARSRLGPRFAEIWVRCPIDICRARDEKGLYDNADAGFIHNLPGVDAPYQAPEQPEVVVDTDRQTPDQAAQMVLARLLFVYEAAVSAA